MWSFSWWRYIQNVRPKNINLTRQRVVEIKFKLHIFLSRHVVVVTLEALGRMCKQHAQAGHESWCSNAAAEVRTPDLSSPVRRITVPLCYAATIKLVRLNEKWKVRVRVKMSVNVDELLSRRSRRRERHSASVLSICLSVCLLVCLSVCRQNTKTRFSQKLSNLELWSLLTTYRKSYMGFSKNPLLDP